MSSHPILLYDPADVPKEEAMLGDIVELSVVVRDLDAAIERYTRVFG